VSELELAPGRHLVRAESLTTLRLPPKEETVALREGEARTLTLELK
jgi:hypothetical protein